MPLLTRSQLLQKQDLKIQKIMLDEKQFVYVREMTGTERDRFEATLLKLHELPDGSIERKQDLEDFRAKLAVFTLCDEKGKLLLQPTDYGKLGDHMRASILSHIADAAAELNQINQNAQEALEKNLPSAGRDGLHSDSA